MGAARFAGDFITATIDSAGVAHLTWMKQEGGTGAASVRYQRIQSAPASAYVAVPCGLTVASQKNHRGSNTYDIDLPFLGRHGVECRTGGAGGNHTIVFTFANNLMSVGSASVTNGSGSVSSSAIGSDRHQYLVNLASVANAQSITVSLTNVVEAGGASTSLISSSMDVLLGDSNGDHAVNSGDAQEVRNRSGQLVDPTNFRSDVNIDGTINSGDAMIVRSKSGTSVVAPRE